MNLRGSVAIKDSRAVPFSGIVTHDAPASGSTSVSGYALKYQSVPTSVWVVNPNAKLSYRNISNVVVTGPSGQLVLGVDYNVDARNGKLRGLKNVADQEVTVTFNYLLERYDAVSINMETMAVAVTKGVERAVDACEYLPAIPASHTRLFNTYVTTSAKTVPVARFFEGKLLDHDRNYANLAHHNRRCLVRTTARLMRGGPLTLVG